MSRAAWNLRSDFNGGDWRDRDPLGNRLSTMEFLELTVDNRLS